MGIRLGEELHASRLVELLQFVKYLRSVYLQLFHADAGDRECAFEVAFAVLDHLLQCIEGRHIGAFGDVVDGALVLVVVVIVMVGTDVEEAIALQMYDLMYFEI